MYRIHCFTEDTCEKYGLLFPENTYQTESLNKVNDTIKTVFNSDKSGISKIVIEKDNFTVNTQNPRELD